MHLCENAYKRVRFCWVVFCFFYVCRNASVCVFVEFPLPFGERVKRPASEENSILSCSYAVVNHQAGMSSAFSCFVNKKRLVIRLFLASTFPLSSASVSCLLHFPECLSTPRLPTLFHPHLRMCLNLLSFSCWCTDVCRESYSRISFPVEKKFVAPFKHIMSCGCNALWSTGGICQCASSTMDCS